MRDLDGIKRIDWQYLVSRREALLCGSITDNAYGLFKKATGIDWHAKHIFRLSDGPVYHSGKELGELRTQLVNGGTPLLLDFCEKLIRSVEALDSIARNIQNIDCSKLDKTPLTQLVEQYIQAALSAHNFLLPLPIADAVLSCQILDALPAASGEDKQKWLTILTYPTKENEHTKEERSFYKLTLAYKQQKKNFNHLLEAHLRNYAWIGARGYWWNSAWKASDIQERLQSLFAQQRKPEDELQHLDALRKETEAAAQELLGRLQIGEESAPHQLILLAREFAYLRTWRTDVIYGAGYKAKGLFSEVAKRAGAKSGDVPYLTYKEVYEMAQTGLFPTLPTELKKRKEYFGTFLINEEYRIVAGNEWKAHLQEIAGQKWKRESQLTGAVACPGVVRGRVKVVLSPDDLRNVERGDILVAVMTFPDFVHAMERAAAFVTDEGGILCHAAIISREMRKPCVIGAKHATKVFKDGDLVEVDAEKGIVRKL